MLIYFVQAAIIGIAGFGRKINSSDKKRLRYVVFAYAMLIVVAGLRKYTVGADLYGHYAKMFERIARLNWGEVPIFKATIDYELGYCYYSKLISCISSDVQFFIFVTSAIICGITCWFFYKNSEDIVMSISLFVFYCINYMYYTMLRQGLAICIILIGYEFLKNKQLGWKRNIIFIGFVLLASMFHSSAILCLVMLLFDKIRFKKKDIILATALSAIAFLFYQKLYDLVNSLIGFGTSNYGRYLSSGTISRESAGSFNLQSLTDMSLCLSAFLLGYYLLVVLKRNRNNSNPIELALSNQDQFLIYMALLASICRMLVFRMNIIYRYSYYFVPFVLILFPRAISQVHGKNKLAYKGLIYGLFICYFIYMTIMKAQTFYMTVPYEFFWE